MSQRPLIWTEDHLRIVIKGFASETLGICPGREMVKMSCNLVCGSPL